MQLPSLKNKVFGSCIIYNKSLNTTQALNFIEEELPATDERDEIVTFIRDSGRGIIKRFTKGSMDDE